jgi:PilZ domain
MFVPGDPRFDDLLELARQAIADGLRDRDRPRWRELVGDLLGTMKAQNVDIPERRRTLRASASLDVHVLSPDDVVGLKTTTVGSGGLSLNVPVALPLGTDLELSVAVEQRPAPLLLRAQVVWSRPGDDGAEIGVAFTDAFQNDRELLEGLAVLALLARAATQ